MGDQVTCLSFGDHRHVPRVGSNTAVVGSDTAAADTTAVGAAIEVVEQLDSLFCLLASMASLSVRLVSEGFVDLVIILLGFESLESLFVTTKQNGVGEKISKPCSYAKETKQQMGSSCSIDQLPTPRKRGEFPTIKILNEAHKRGLDGNKFSLVGRLDLMKTKISKVRQIAIAQWKPEGVCRIIPVGKGYFTLFLDNEKDKNNIWMGKADAGIGSSEKGRKDGIASSSSTGGKDSDLASVTPKNQIIKETNSILLNKDKNWADMVGDEERDEACVAQEGARSTSKAKRGTIKEFNDCLDECELQESVTSGMKLTWCNGQSGGTRISRRLDRALYNSQWASSFDGWKVKVMARENSDHSALVGGPNSIPKPMNILFYFLKCWIEIPRFNELVHSSWEKVQDGNPLIKLMKKIQRLKAEIKIWKKEAIGDLKVEVSKCSADLESLHSLIKFPDDGDLIKAMMNKENELNQLMKLKNSIWHQKSRLYWLTDGERNSAFFHSMYKIKNTDNSITEVVTTDGTSIMDLNDIQSHIVEHYTDNNIDFWQDCWGSNTSLKNSVEVDPELWGYCSAKLDAIIDNNGWCAPTVVAEFIADYGIYLKNMDVNCNMIDKRVWRHNSQVVPIWHWIMDIFLFNSYPQFMKKALGMGDNLNTYVKDLWRSAVTNLAHLIWLSRNAAISTKRSMPNSVSDLLIISKLGVSTRARPALCIKSCRWILPWYKEIKLNYDSSTMGNPGKASLGTRKGWKLRALDRRDDGGVEGEDLRQSRSGLGDVRFSRAGARGAN
ncbi:hypothetical protein GIB67_019982 [Kingdonia uniflora]|uniref:Uncharacterized protein n=1 Tax=Kingdonia uniflora TaxID=39325 RepID=A0A7J7MKP5_9MAGN|nr:hypothetical protein GIB67_019982 [Kingdonia uniflora]